MSVLMLPKWGIDIASLFSHEGRPRAHRPVWGETEFSAKWERAWSAIDRRPVRVNGGQPAQRQEINAMTSGG